MAISGYRHHWTQYTEWNKRKKQKISDCRKNTTQKAKMMSNTDPIRKIGMNPCDRESKQFLFIIRSPPCCPFSRPLICIKNVYLVGFQIKGWLLPLSFYWLWSVHVIVEWFYIVWCFMSCNVFTLYNCTVIINAREEEFEDTKGVIRIRNEAIVKRKRTTNALQNITQKTKNKPNPTKSRGWTQGHREGKQFLPH